MRVRRPSGRAVLHASAAHWAVLSYMLLLPIRPGCRPAGHCCPSGLAGLPRRALLSAIGPRER
eukprot:7387195-Prymnesium_polylepis.1